MIGSPMYFFLSYVRMLGSPRVKLLCRGNFAQSCSWPASSSNGSPEEVIRETNLCSSSYEDSILFPLCLKRCLHVLHLLRIVSPLPQSLWGFLLVAKPLTGDILEGLFGVLGALLVVRIVSSRNFMVLFEVLVKLFRIF